jgi:hypothetical protein
MPLAVVAARGILFGGAEEDGLPWLRHECIFATTTSFKLPS